MPVTSHDHRVAAEVAAAAGTLLLELRSARAYDPPEVLKDAGDREAHEFIVDELARRRPGDALLSEEGADNRARIGAPRVWIVDPLDGTREYAEGRADWAVHVALVVDGAVAAAAVALPGAGLTLATEPAPPFPPAHAGPPRVVVSRSRPPAIADEVARRLGGELVPLGSAGAKTMAVVLGDAEVYVHDGGQHEWDSAAPVGVALAAGLHASRLDGSPLVYNRPDPWLPDLVVCRPELAAEVLAVVAHR
jgi:3'(2'), 5'-bisphosphate nucleotidase